MKNSQTIGAGIDQEASLPKRNGFAREGAFLRQPSQKSYSQGQTTMNFDYTKKWAGNADFDFVTTKSGARLRYIKTGAGPNLLVLHTLRTQLDNFQKLVPLLAQRFTVYAVDLPGFGWSDIRPGASYDEPSVRREVLDFIKQLDLRDLTLVGESIGATLSLGIAAELGTRIRRVVAVNTYDYPQGIERGNLISSVLVKAMRIPVIGLIPAKMENPVVLNLILRGGFFDAKHIPQDFVSEMIRSGRRVGFARVVTNYFRSIKSYAAARQNYHRITVPVTLVYGQYDWSRPSERQEVAKLVPKSEIVTLANTGHFASLEQPQKIANIVIGNQGTA